MSSLFFIAIFEATWQKLHKGVTPRVIIEQAKQETAPPDPRPPGCQKGPFESLSTGIQVIANWKGNFLT